MTSNQFFTLICYMIILKDHPEVEEVLQKMMTKEENIDDYDYEKLVKGGAKI